MEIIIIPSKYWALFWVFFCFLLEVILHNYFILFFNNKDIYTQKEQWEYTIKMTFL